MLKSTQYTIDGGCISTVEVGDAQTADISVVFIHGWLDNAASFFSVMQALSALSPQLHLCAIDLPGHGLSQHKQGSNFYLFHDYIDDVCQLLLNFAANKQLIVGHSLGALIASCYSAAFPEKVDGLVQIEGYEPLAENAAKCVERLRNGVISRQRIRNKPVRSYARLEHAIEHRCRVNHLTAEQIAPIVTRGMIQVEGKWLWRHDNKLKSESLYRMSPEHTAEIMASIECPQRVILGEQGYANLLNNRSDLVKNGLEMFTISGGHHCHLQHPEVVADLIYGVVNKI